ncbi:hypothetical protein ACFQUU_13745 [Herbaspirillum sp. GCM10030257]|uniref:hypothetical protein n=1 Tax=Herbaspirillum sp. GCM10030257 TaxID=3273393 RepID=UPI0036200EF1
MHAELGQIKKMASDRTPSHDDPLKKVLNNADLMAHAKQEWLTPLSGIDEGDLKARNAFLNEQLIPKFARAILDQYKAVDPKKLTPEQQQDIGKLEQLAIPPRRSAPPPPPPPRRSAPPPPHAGMSHEQHLEALQQQGAKMHEMELKAAAEALERLEAKRIMDSIKFIAKMIEDWGRIGN